MLNHNQWIEMIIFVVNFPPAPLLELQRNYVR